MKLRHRVRLHNSQRRLTGIGLSLLALTFLAGCKDQNTVSGGVTATTNGNTTGSASSGNQIIVGEYGSLTGKEATFGKSCDNGIQLATEETNKQGGVGGKQIVIVTEDDTSDASKAATAVKRLIDEKNVVAVLGEVASGNSIAGAQVCQPKGVPMITPASTKPSVTQVGDCIFRVCFIDPYQSAVVARFAHDKLNAKRVAVFTDKGAAYSTGFSADFKKAFLAMGGQIAAEQSYSGGDKDFRGALTAIQSSNPDAILVPGYYTDAGSIAKQARELGIKVPLLGGDGWDSADLFKSGGDALNGCYFSDHLSVDSTDPKIATFVKDYTAKFHQKPDANSALGYDAAKLLFNAMTRAKSISRTDIKDAIAQTKDFPGVTGNITINKDRNADKPAVIIAIQNQQFKFDTAIADPNVPIK